MKNILVRKVRKALAGKPNIVIVTHWSPDGDAMGSSLGLYNFLKAKKYKVNVITPNDYPSFLRWLPGNKWVVDFKKEKIKATALVKKANVIFCLDFNSLKRIDELGGLIERSEAKKIMIDHHPSPENFSDISLHDEKASSTAELVYEFIIRMGTIRSINKNIANCLYTGIMTDTGSFRFSSTSPNTHRIVANLIERGAQHVEIHSKIYDDNSAEKMLLLGHSLSKMVSLPEFRTAYIVLSQDELKLFKYKKGDTEGLVNYGLSIEGVIFSAFFVERDGMVKISFRSKGKFNVNAFARKYFNGGGHVNAAGGGSSESLMNTVNLFLKVLPKYKKELVKG